MWQKNVLNRAVSSRSGTDWGLVADVTYREGLKEGLLVVKNKSTKRTSVISSSSIESVDDSLIVSDAASFESFDERDAGAIYAKGLLKKAVTSLSGCDVGHVKDFGIDPDSKEIGLEVGVSIQAFHLEIMIPWSKVEAVDETIEASDAAVLHLCLGPLY
jgi:sporulation protein YlmC with PRC-barrel domain